MLIIARTYQYAYVPSSLHKSSLISARQWKDREAAAVLARAKTSGLRAEVWFAHQKCLWRMHPLCAP